VAHLQLDAPAHAAGLATIADSRHIDSDEHLGGTGALVELGDRAVESSRRGGGFRVGNDLCVRRSVGADLIKERTGRRLLPQRQPLLHPPVIQGVEVYRRLLGIL
jgi:hypothetical protein